MDRPLLHVAPYLAAAHPVEDLVAEVAAGARDEDAARAVHAAEHIAAFYEHFAMSDADALVFVIGTPQTTCGGGRT